MEECGGLTRAGRRCQRTTYLRKCCGRCHSHCPCKLGRRVFIKRKVPRFTRSDMWVDSEEEKYEDEDLVPDEDDIDFIAPEGKPEIEQWGGTIFEPLKKHIQKKKYRVITESDGEY